MSIHVALHHRTSYRYDRPVGHGPHVVRLKPAPHCRTRVLAYSLKIEPGPHFLNWQQDPLANHQARLVFPEKLERLDVTVDLVAEMAVFNPFDFFLEPGAENFPFRYDPALAHELAPYLVRNEAGPLLPLSSPLLDAELVQATLLAFMNRCAETTSAQPPALLLLEADQLTPEAQAELLGFFRAPAFELRTLVTALAEGVPAGG